MFYGVVNYLQIPCDLFPSRAPSILPQTITSFRRAGVLTSGSSLYTSLIFREASIVCHHFHSLSIIMVLTVHIYVQIRPENGCLFAVCCKYYWSITHSLSRESIILSSLEPLLGFLTFCQSSFVPWGESQWSPLHFDPSFRAIMAITNKWFVMLNLKCYHWQLF